MLKIPCQSDLKIRPIYHWKSSRVKAHLAISFMAYILVRYLEHRVRLQYKKMSPEKIKQILLSVQTSILYDTTTNRKFALPSKVTDDAKKIYDLIKKNECIKHPSNYGILGVNKGLFTNGWIASKIFETV